MEDPKAAGQGMHASDAERRSEAARELGSARTPAKIEAAKAAAAARKGKPLSEEHKAKLRAANLGKTRRGVSEETREKLREASARRWGPKKQDAGTPANVQETPENGAQGQEQASSGGAAA